MQVLIKKCDRCGAIIGEREFNNTGSPITMPGKYTIAFKEINESTYKAENCENYELCDNCAVSFLDWMKKDSVPVVSCLNTPETLDIPEKQPIRLKPGTRTHHTWTSEDDDFILHHSAGLTIKQIAYKLGVTVAAVQARKFRLLSGEV